MIFGRVGGKIDIGLRSAQTNKSRGREKWDSPAMMLSSSKPSSYPEANPISFPIFTSRVPLYGSHLSASCANRRCPFYMVGPAAVFSVQTMLYTEIIHIIRMFGVHGLNAVYGDWRTLAKFLRPLKQSMSAVGWFQVCDPLK